MRAEMERISYRTRPSPQEDEKTSLAKITESNSLSPYTARPQRSSSLPDETLLMDVLCDRRSRKPRGQWFSVPLLLSCVRFCPIVRSQIERTNREQIWLYNLRSQVQDTLIKHTTAAVDLGCSN